MTFSWLFFAAIAFAILDWVSAWKEWTVRLYVAKPATLIFLILWSLQQTHWQGGMIWFGAALIFSLLGDVALMLNARYFLAGVAAFLFAHVMYLIGFNQNFSPLSMGSVLTALLVGMAASQILKVIRPGIQQMPGARKMLPAMTVYGMALTLMLLSALLTMSNPAWNIEAAVIVSVGACLFFVSDSTLSYDRFVKKLKHGRCWVHVTYHLGQITLITGVVMHFVK